MRNRSHDLGHHLRNARKGGCRVWRVDVPRQETWVELSAGGSGERVLVLALDLYALVCALESGLPVCIVLPLTIVFTSALNLHARLALRGELGC